MICHCVFFWLKQNEKDVAAKMLECARTQLSGIPGVRNLLAGAPIPSTRPVVDCSYDVAISMSFDSKSDLDAYAGHPAHKNFVQGFVEPHVERCVVYDFS